jgi:Flp pilus assembly protein TadD
VPGDSFRADARPTVADDRVHADVLLRDGRVAFQSGRVAEALAIFVRAANANPHAAGCAGVPCQALGRLDEAEAWHRRATERAPGDPFVLSNLGTCLAARGRFAEAVEVLRRASATDPGDGDAFTRGLEATYRELWRRWCRRRRGR